MTVADVALRDPFPARRRPASLHALAPGGG